MLQIIPIKERKENQVDTENLFYIPNEIKTDDETIVLNSMAEKYNYAIENIVLKQDKEVNICFRHEDSEIRTDLNTCEFKLNKLFENGEVACAGLIGTMQLETSCTWWTPNRPLQTAGYIIQGGVQPKLDENKQEMKDENGKTIMENIEYPMADFPGVHDYMATVDGCCMFFPKWVFEKGIRFDTRLKEYHFYDCDICLQLIELGYKVATIDIVVKHQSSGIPSQNFNELRMVFFNKWNNKVRGQWPISKYSKFYEEQLPPAQKVETENKEETEKKE